MSSLPSLTEWTQSRLTSIYTATSPETFHAALDAFYSPNIDATVNDEKQTRDNIREKMEASWRFAGNGCEVEWKDCKCQDENEKENGEVNGSFVVTRRSKLRVRAAPMTHYTTVNFTARIDQDSVIESDSDGDRRRVVHLVQTSEDKAAPINLNPRAMGQAMDRGQ